jgi:outer membrane protein assembly factor BamB
VWGETVFAFDQLTGDTLWVETQDLRYPMPQPYRVLVDEHAVYVNDERLRALDKQTGKPLWSVGLVSIGARMPSIGAALYQTDTRLFLPIGSEANPKAVLLLEFDKRSGTLIGTTELLADGDISHHTPYQGELTDDGMLYLPTSYEQLRDGSFTDHGRLYAFDTQTTSIRWTFEVPKRPHARLSNEGAGFDFVDLEAGATGAAVSEDLVAAAGPTLFALDHHTGDIAWEYAFDEINGFYLNDSLSADEKRSYGRSIKGDLMAWDVRTGRVLWSTPIPSSLSVPAVPHRNRLYFTHDVGKGLYVLDKQTGFVLARKDPPDMESTRRERDLQSLYWTPPAVDGDTLYLGGTLGFYAMYIGE